MMTRSFKMVSANDEDTTTLATAELLRGPCLIAMAVLSVLISLVQRLSLLFMIQLGLLTAGLLLSVHDMARIGHQRLRVLLKEFLDTIVLDNAMMKFYNPDTNWYNLWIGQSCMYLLPMSPEQRLRALQSTLGVNEEEALAILYKPGGFKAWLFPSVFLTWLEGTPSVESSSPSADSADPLAGTVGEDEISNSSCLESSVSCNGTPTRGSLEEDMVVVSSNVSKERPPTDAVEKKQQPLPPSMSRTMGTIAMELLAEHYKTIVGSPPPVPSTTQVMSVGAVAAMCLGVQLRHSRRSRAIIMGLLEASTMVGLASVCGGATSVLLSQHLHHHGMERIAKVIEWRAKLLAQVAPASSAEHLQQQSSRSRRKVKLIAAALIVAMGFARKTRQRKNR